MIRKHVFKWVIVSVVMAGFVGCTGTPEKKTLSVEQKIDSLLTEMTLEEKVTMIHANVSFTTGAVPRLGIPEWTMSDGPHGVRKEHGRGWVGSESPEYLAVNQQLPV